MPSLLDLQSPHPATAALCFYHTFATTFLHETSPLPQSRLLAFLKASFTNVCSQQLQPSQQPSQQTPSQQPPSLQPPSSPPDARLDGVIFFIFLPSVHYAIQLFTSCTHINKSENENNDNYNNNNNKSSNNKVIDGRVATMKDALFVCEGVLEMARWLVESAADSHLLLFEAVSCVALVSSRAGEALREECLKGWSRVVQRLMAQDHKNHHNTDDSRRCLLEGRVLLRRLSGQLQAAVAVLSRLLHRDKHPDQQLQQRLRFVTSLASKLQPYSVCEEEGSKYVGEMVECSGEGDPFQKLFPASSSVHHVCVVLLKVACRLFQFSFSCFYGCLCLCASMCVCSCSYVFVRVYIYCLL